MLNISASYSTLAATDLLEHVVPQYQVKSPIRCEFWLRGLNDTYKITAKTDNYILRVYRKDWRTLSQIKFEVDALNYLHEQGANVSYPIKRLDGEYVTTLNTPEGVRYVIVTAFAEGAALSYDDVQDAYIYGANVADIHTLSAGFASEHPRFELDHVRLLSEPLECIRPFLAHRPECWKFLENFGARLLSFMEAIRDQDADYGLCHGDFHGWNAHYHSDTLTFFDFDDCGYGWRAYDLAVFRWDARLDKKENERWAAFIKGYRSKRDISDADLKLTTTFMAIRDIWLMGEHMGNAKDFGRGWMGDEYIDERIAFLKAIEEEHFA
ncbi:MAG: phosphotransferase enzyme family protein [Thiolinea sp.]